MAELTFHLPDEFADWIEEQAAELGYADAGGFLMALLHGERERRKPPMTLGELQALLADARKSGTSTKSVEDIIAEGRRLARARMSQRHGSFTR